MLLMSQCILFTGKRNILTVLEWLSGFPSILKFCYLRLSVAMLFLLNIFFFLTVKFDLKPFIYSRNILVVLLCVGLSGWKASMYSRWIANTKWLGEPFDNNFSRGWYLHLVLKFWICTFFSFDHLMYAISYFLYSGQAEEILGDEGCWWRTLEEVMCFACILGSWPLWLFKHN